MNDIALTFAIGDVHGCFDKLDDLMRRCADYAGSRPHKFVMLGDYIDRGPDSRSVARRDRGRDRLRAGQHRVHRSDREGPQGHGLAPWPGP